ncbi:MAG: Uma2 family endonuclease [Eubacteriales bacterium]|nr:Uma2 family endonuclease [Eubacteriales bacterium]
MPLPKELHYTAQDYWNLPDGQRAELIEGQLYAMAPPSRIHQELVYQLGRTIGNYIAANNGSCKVYPAPFAVNLNADDSTYVEPDISVICDRSKLTDRGCNGAPDFIIEIVSPGSRRMDYSTKNFLYAHAGVREYWIVDPTKHCTTVYRYESDDAPTIIPFSQELPVGIYEDLQLRIADFIE